MQKPRLKQSILPKEAALMLAHFKKFNLKMGLDLSKPLVIACSGGLDSMALAHLLIMSKAQVRLIHIDHGTRPEIADEIKLISDFARLYNVEFKSYSLKLSLNAGNFEAQARKQRYLILLKELVEGESLVTGHHLDDCFEWSLLQQFKSQAKDIDLGIPYRNGRIYRPLFAFSKKHLLKYANLVNLKWLEDHSNNDTRFERNHIRRMIKESIASRWPGYLKHYSERMNRMNSIKEGLAKKSYKVLKRKWGILIKHHGQVDEELKKIILSQAGTKRGKTFKQFNELESLLSKSSHGPLVFSGGIKVYAFGPYLAVVRNGMDIEFLDSNATQIPDRVPFLSNNTSAKHGLKKGPIQVASLNKIFSEIKQPVHYSWRKDGKVLVWF